jgi:hypothetical protein
MTDLIGRDNFCFHHCFVIIKMSVLKAIIVLRHGGKEYKHKLYHINYKSNQQFATIRVNLLFLVSSTCFGGCFHPSSGTIDYV